MHYAIGYATSLHACKSIENTHTHTHTHIPVYNIYIEQKKI